MQLKTKGQGTISMKNFMLFLLLLILNYSIYSQGKWHIEKDSMNIAILVSDYQTYKFEEGVLSHYAANDSIVSEIPIKSKYEAPVDFGSITFLNIINNDTLFSASILWQGQGKINFPNDFQPADSFIVLQTAIQAPLSIEYYFNPIAMLDSTIYIEKADSAWNELKNLEIVNEFNSYSYRIGMYLYTPGEGVPTQNGFSNTAGAKWIVFLYYDSSTITDVEVYRNLPNQFKLYQNYPNPFNPSTIINYQIPKDGLVSLKIYNVLGKEVETLVSRDQPAGKYQVTFNTSAKGFSLPSGIYFYQLQAGNYIETKKMVILK
ncbi:MAG TPA: T9SS type A sorting domain-containing protein [Ignavibacteria bacterium]|nr:T9SS type A sorting domain-containing protein [Ignavibacteria bacterium]